MNDQVKKYTIHDPDSRSFIDKLLNRSGTQVGEQTTQTIMKQAPAKRIHPFLSATQKIVQRSPWLFLGGALGSAATMGNLYYDAYRTPTQYWEGAF